MDALVSKYTEDWDKLRQSDEGTKLERRIEMGDMAHTFSDAYKDLQTEDQKAAAGRGMGDMFGAGMGQDSQWFNGTKGYGFITQDGGGEDVFCHHTAIKAEGFRSLAEGQKVEFEVVKGPKGLQAQNVRKLS